LVLYERFGKIRSHLKVSKTLFSKFKAGSLDDSDKAILIFHVKKMSATLQGQVVSKRYRTQKRLRQRKAKRAVAYFKILAEVEPSTRHLSYFHAAETFYSINFFESAIPLYETASQKAKETGDIKIFNLATDGILAAISGRGVKASTKEKYLIPAYESYLEKNPNSAKSSKIYQRLFSVYFDKKNLPKAEAILLTFRDKYPKNLKVHEAMLGKIMDHYKKNNNRDGIKIWINRINNGEIKVSEKYSRKIKRLLLSIQFENVEKANAKGDKKRALKLYLEIYKDRESTKDARKNASYNIAVLFHELGQIEKSYGWAQRSLGLMSPVDVQKFQTAFLTVAAELFNKRMFKESAEIYHRSFEKLCSRKTRNKKILFKNAIIIYLAEAEIDKASKVLGASYKCNLAKKVLIEAEFDLLNAMITQKNWDTIPGRISKLEKDLKIQAQLIEPLYKLSIAYRDSGKLDKQIKMNKKILNYYKSLKRKKVKIPLAALDIVAGLKLMRLDADFSKISKIKLSFPEARYNSRLKKKFAQLDSITTKAVAVLEIGSGRGIVKAYRYLISSYRGLVKEIREFVPAKKPEAYVKSFRKTMKSITRPILKKANEFNREALRHIRSNKILSPDNVYFLSNRALPLDIQYSYYQDGLIMDKGGKK
ncbi:MAG: hypothetical protein HOM21_09365, partial [Halobacteriovoraceae bacterium]|nr:hypothetical protein [Halobacteriovoraceae bacterium]